MFELRAYQNSWLRIGQTQLQAVLTLSVPEGTAAGLAVSLALAVVIDRSASMDGQKITAAKQAARQVILAADDSVLLTVIAFNERAQVLVPPRVCSDANKITMLRAIDALNATGGTCMSTGLNAAVENLRASVNRARKVLFLTDGKNEGEKHTALGQAVGNCREMQFQVTAWGVGTAWDEEELRYIGGMTMGSADIIPSPEQVTEAFGRSFALMQKTLATDVRLCLWTPVGVQLRRCRQMYPDIVPMTGNPDESNPRCQFLSLGSFGRGEHREYLLELEIPAYPPGPQYLLARPSLLYQQPGQLAAEQKPDRAAWIFGQWTDDEALAARLDPYVTHYTDQAELTASVQQGQEALLQGDRARATQLLGVALSLSERVGNEDMTRLLHEVLTRDAHGTIKLNDGVGPVARKTLSLHATRTSRLS